MRSAWYRSIIECVHHYDVANGKNYFYYFNTPVRQWIVLPWDVDLTWKDTNSIAPSTSRTIELGSGTA